MFADEIRRAVEAAPRVKLPEVAALLWRAYGAGQVSEAEAEVLSVLIDSRKASGMTFAAERSANDSGPAAGPPGSPRTGVGSRPRTDASMERRRRWAASGRLPPAIAARFTLAEQAVLSLVAAETARRGDCRLAVGHLAALVGVAETTVRNAVREARKLGLVTVEERRATGWRNDTNIVRIVSAEWTAWLRLARRGGFPGRQNSLRPTSAKGGGCKSANPTPTEGSHPVRIGASVPVAGLPEGSGRPQRKGIPGIGAGGRMGRAMP